MLQKISFWMIAVVLSVFLAACDTAEERAQKHYEKGVALLEAGDVDRALVEFRNVFKLNGSHRDARAAYAQVQEQRGDVQSAYSNYLRLIEQYPEDGEGRSALARMASDLNNWEEVARHIEVAERLSPEDPVVQSVRAGLDYRNAVQENNPDTVQLAVQVSEALLSDHPDLTAAQRVVIDDLLRRQDWDNALAAIDSALLTSDDRNLYRLRLAVLDRMGRNPAIVAQLKEMVEKFPEENIHIVLVGRLVAEGQLEEAENYLLQRVDEKAGDASQTVAELIAFLAENRSRTAAIAEVDRILPTEPEQRNLLRSLRAGLVFEEGDRDAAILEMEDILKDAEASAEINHIKVALAQMLGVTGNQVGARARVEEVLENDSNQIEAIKLKAGWLIQNDRPGDALVDLRGALDQAPRDAQLMTLMAQAHNRSGNHDLMGEMLVLAVEASGNAPEETLRYVSFLLQEKKFLPAEDVLKAALRVQPDDPALLVSLGGLYVQMKDWPRTQHVVDTLLRQETEQASSLANELTIRMMAGRNQATELEQFLTGLAEQDSGLQAGASIIRLRLAQGDVEAARLYAEELLSQDQSNPTLRFLHAGVLIADNQYEAGTVALEELTTELPQNEQIWLALYRLHSSQGKDVTASQVLAEARATLPDSINLNWVAAGAAEAKGDIDTAIAIYEKLYAANSSSTIIANNYASLIASYHDSDESLQRAYEVARRLRGTDLAPYQDTYGWIAHRLGNHEEALEYLETAASSLPQDPLVQFHLAQNYAALGRNDEALALYQKVAEMLADAPQRPAYLDQVEAAIKTLVAN